MQIGCNYWASHAGTRMWVQWDENVVREDFKRLVDIGA
jgi:endo-1,4-beta-mannosidase